MKSNLVSAPLPWAGLTRLRVSRAFTTTAGKSAIPAPSNTLIDFNNNSLPRPNAANARIIPASPSYFTGSPQFTDNYLHLQALLRRYERLPTVPRAHAPRVAWRALPQYRAIMGEPVPEAKYHKVLVILKRLNRILPALMPPALKEAMQLYKADFASWDVIQKPQEVDAIGRACGIGRRKSSVAKVFLVQGEGEVLVNGKSINRTFGRIHDRESALWALKATDRMDKYNVWALASGGGTTGQAEAITLGVAKALIVHEPGLKPALRRAGCITRNPKRVERKKAGRYKARKAHPWVKG